MNQKDWFEKLAQSEKEALYRAELENYSEKMVLNTENRIVFINAKYAAEFGKHPEELEGTSFDELLSVSENYVPPLLELRDFASPYIPLAERIKSETRPAVFIRAPLTADDGSTLGYMIYDGRDWLQRYRSLFLKLNELEDEYQYFHLGKPRDMYSHFVGNLSLIHI